MKKALLLLLCLSLAISLCGCGISEPQQSFLDSVGQVETAEGNRVEAIKTAFAAYSLLSDNECRNNQVIKALEQLEGFFNVEIAALSEAPMTLSLDAKISTLEEIVSMFSDKLKNEISGCAELKDIRNAHYAYYIEQRSEVYENVTKISESFDALNLAETDSLIQETLPRMEELCKLSYKETEDAQLQDYGMTTLEDGKKTLEELQALIPEICYTDCFVVRFEYLCDYPESNMYSNSSEICYKFSGGRKLNTSLSEYKDYMDKHFNLIKTEYSDGDPSYFYDVGCENPLKLSRLEMHAFGMNLYTVWVTPPYMSDAEKNCGSF